MSDWPQKRVLVTGGAGFIGSALVWELNRRGCANVAIADFAPREERERYLRHLRFTEYLDPDAVLLQLAAGSLGAFDFVFHIGACSSTTETDVAYLTRTNYEYSRDLAAWAVSAGARFIYASSAATYGDGSAGMSDADPGSMERLRPLNAYGWSKHRMDLHAWRQGWLDRIVGLKYFNVFGPNEYHKGEMRSMVHKAFVQAQETGVVRLFKSYRAEYRDGEQRRDFLYVKDAVAMTLHLAAEPTAAGIFNIGSGQAHTWNELAGAVFAALGRKPCIEYIDMPEAVRGQYQYFTQADIGRLRASGYVNPVTSLREAIRDYTTRYLLPGKPLGEEIAETVE